VSSKSEEKKVDRKTRYKSHALVEFRKSKWFPFHIHSGVLLDLSLGGFKMEFTGEHVIQANSNYWISIPLGPLGIATPSKFQAQIEARWFDNKRFRVGGSFLNLSEADKHVLSTIISRLEERGLAHL